jgi:V8-like Glu-specific endopeptidase
MVPVGGEVVAPPLSQQARGTVDILGGQPRWSLIRPVQAAASPHSAIASLRLHIVGAGGTSVFFMGTGWFMTPTTLVTAAHVTDISRPWASVAAPRSWHLEVIPGFADDVRPFGTFWAVGVIRHPSWTGRPTTSHDIAVVKVAPEAGLSFPHQHCLKPLADAITASSQPAVTIAGYPHIIDSGGTPVVASGAVHMVEGHLCFYDIDTEDGQSGAPVMTSAGGASSGLVAAVHSGGQGSGSTSLSNALNAGLRLRQELVTWINAQ